VAQFQRITPCLWFDKEAEEAANLYTSIFPNSRIISTTRYSNVGQEIHGQEAGSVMLVRFALDGLELTALNGGPVFTFNESISLQIACDSQEEIDHYWASLTAGGGKEGPCGWLKDRFGLSWQVSPAILQEMLRDPDPERVAAVTTAYMGMKKFDIEALKRAFAGGR